MEGGEDTKGISDTITSEVDCFRTGCWGMETDGCFETGGETLGWRLSMEERKLLGGVDAM